MAKTVVMYAGGNTEYQFPFDYLRKEFVKVSLVAADGTTTDKVYGSDYTVTDRKITLKVASDATGEVRIWRSTTTKPITAFSDASVLRARTLNALDTQLLHIAEENSDAISMYGMSFDSADNTWQGMGRIIKNVKNPLNPQDAVTLNYLDSVGVARAAQMEALAAQITADKSNSEVAAAAALVSEKNAKTSETNAKVSETASKTSETNAKVSEMASKTSETNASKSCENAIANANQASSVLGGATTALYESTGAGIISGLSTTVIGMTATVAAGIAHMPSGLRYEVAEATLTIPTADATNARLDLIYVSSVGVVTYLAGTPSVNPVVPTLPSGGFSLSNISVAANATMGVVTDIRIFKTRYQNSGIISVKDFGAIGDGESHPLSSIYETLEQAKEKYPVATSLSDEIDWCSIQTAINKNKYKRIILPIGKYVVNRSILISNSIIIEGYNFHIPFVDYNYPQNNLSGSEIVLLSAIATSNVDEMSIIKIETTDPVVLKNFTVNGNDGEWISKAMDANFVPGGTFDQYATFTGANINGIESSMSNFKTDGIKVKNVSGSGLISNVWTFHYNSEFSFCNIAIQMNGGDSLFSNPFIHHCNSGIILGDSAGTMNCDSTRINNCRIEWIKEFGILLRHANNILVSGWVERCGYAGLANDPTMSPIPGVQSLQTSNLHVARCGAFYRDTPVSSIPAGSEYKASNIYINTSASCILMGTSKRQPVNDITTFSTAQSPTFGIYNVNCMQPSIYLNYLGFDEDNYISTKFISCTNAFYMTKDTCRIDRYLIGRKVIISEGYDSSQVADYGELHGYNDTFRCGMDIYVTEDNAGKQKRAIRINPNGYTGIGTHSPLARLDVEGDTIPHTDNAHSLGASGYRWSTIWGATSTIATSDARKKTNVAISDLGLDFIKSLNPVTYKWINGENEVTEIEDGTEEVTIKEAVLSEDGTIIEPAITKKETKYKTVVTPRGGIRHHYGLLAQDVEKSLTENNIVKDFAGLVYDKNADLYGLRYEEFIAPIIKAIQEVNNKLKKCIYYWEENTTYEIENICLCGKNIYTCTTAGTSGTIAPAATSGIVADGTVIWTYKETLG